MEYRFVGKSGLQISAISLGGWLTYGGHVGDENTFACLKAAFDTGINFFDCAEGYAGGESEKVMGRAIKHFGWNRNDIVVSTKVRRILLSSIREDHMYLNAEDCLTPSRSTGARTTPLSLPHATKSTTLASPANISSKQPPPPSSASNFHTSISSTRIALIATHLSRNQFVHSTTSSTPARHYTGAHPNGLPAKSKRHGP